MWNNSVARGYFYSNGEYKHNSAILEVFSNNSDFDAFCNTCLQGNGVFSVFVKGEAEVFLYVAPGGFYKLFYTLRNGKLEISDMAHQLSHGKLNPGAMLEYRASLFCWGDKTLFADVFSVEPGIAIRINKDGVIRRKLFNYAVSRNALMNNPFDDLIEAGKTIFGNVAERMVRFLNGRQAVVPLSGGYDSRFILAALVSAGYKNIVAVTYGAENVPEVANAEKVAHVLGVKWYFAAYSPGDIQEISGRDYDSYFRFMVNGNSFPCMHEILMSEYLKSNGLVDNDAVFIPGHSGDFLGGSQYVKVFPPDLRFHQIASTLVRKKFDTSFYSREQLRKRKNDFENLVKYNYSPSASAASVFEDIDMAEKLTKHILNAANVYTYFGYSCYFPFWDRELIDFFSKVPADLKIDKKLYDHILKEIYFEPLGISFTTEMKPSVFALKLQNLKNLIRLFLPGKVKQYYTRKNDFYGYHMLTKQWRKALELNGLLKKGRDYSYNTIIANQVIYQLKNQVNSSE